ncbi:probable fructokinase-7 [Tanacetum coccineum]|uniref:Probable fructokinase-7 n=1 Tax=Tanacetum coccineum TaxID=301880 RepID=A0ABQ4YXU3_9ASTR
MRRPIRRATGSPSQELEPNTVLQLLHLLKVISFAKPNDLVVTVPGLIREASPIRLTPINKGGSKDFSLYSSKDQEAMKSLVVCFGEMLIDFVPSVSGVSLAEASVFEKAPGGAPANVAVGISRLGGSSAFIGKVGDDQFGYMLADILKENKVNNSGMRFDPNARTALAFISLKSDGEREFLFFRNPSADMLLQESELDVNLIKQAKIFHFGSISLINEPCMSAHLAAMAIAKKSGSILSYDVNLRLPLWPSEDAAREGIMSVWDQADVIKVSEDEIMFLTGVDNAYDDNVVLKKLFHPNLKLFLTFKGRVPGVKVKPIDTTGAGDAFVSGILSVLVSDLSLYEDEKRLREALNFANACGALVVTKKGAIPAMPTNEEVHQILKQD